jgi:hypothetical protein
MTENTGGGQKLAFYQLNYSRSSIPFRYRRISVFRATANLASLGIHVLPLNFEERRANANRQNKQCIPRDKLRTVPGLL